MLQYTVHQRTEVCLASFLSRGFTTIAVISPWERKLANRTYVAPALGLLTIWSLWGGTQG